MPVARSADPPNSRTNIETIPTSSASTNDSSKRQDLVSVVDLSADTAQSDSSISPGSTRPTMAPAPGSATPVGPAITPVSSDQGGLLSAVGQLPPGERPQMTKSQQFQLEYDIDAVGPSGVAEVQLWATLDGGRTWRLWGTDDDRQSPFDIAVDNEGIFGFRIVIVNRNGLVGPRPRSGDPADIWIGVDLTPPVVRLTSATYGKGTRAGQLVIHWSAEDANLARRPITLLQAESSDGPWSIIAAGLPNEGEYAWPADPHLPPAVYLRIEARDMADNVGSDQTAESIRIDGLAPKARIRGLMRHPRLDREAFHIPQRR